MRPAATARGSLALALLIAALAIGQAPARGQDGLTSEDVFPAEDLHNHASCLVELPGGDLLVTWYRGSGERKADDVVIYGSRLKPGAAAWEPRFVMADTPGYPDCNPALFAAPDGSVWLFWPTILDHRWEGALLKYKVAAAPGTTGAPEWTDQGVLHVTPDSGKFVAAAQAALNSPAGLALKLAKPKAFAEISDRITDELYQRLGWMPRVRPLVLPSGRWLLPLYTDTYSASLVAITDDRGQTWSFSEAIIGMGNIQPSLVRREDGTIVAFMRENGMSRHIRLSTSKDDGRTWSPVTTSSLPNPGAGVDAIRLRDGRWAIVYNDTFLGRHSLAVSISDDEGTSWKWTRHVERVEPEGGQFHYPSILQTADDAIHLSYTRRLKGAGSTIRHARLDADWVCRGDPKP